MSPLALVSSAIVVGAGLTFIALINVLVFVWLYTVESIACVDWCARRKVLKTCLQAGGVTSFLCHYES